MNKEKCNELRMINCCLCPDAVLVYPRTESITTFRDFAEIVGLWDALALAEVVCPYRTILEDLREELNERG